MPNFKETRSYRLNCEDALRWKRVLYAKQPFPDNYCGPEFMHFLRKNENIKLWTFREAVVGSCYLMQQVSSVLLFVILFNCNYYGWIRWQVILLINGICFAVGYPCYLWLVCTGGGLPAYINPYYHLKTGLMYVGYTYALSPICQTLTATVSTDSIIATASLMFFASVVFYNYGCDVYVVSKALSLNAAMFATICLISRLPSSNEVFVMLTTFIAIFVLWPIVREKFQECFPRSIIPCTILLATSVVIGLAQWTHVMAIVYVIVHLIISLACPWLFIALQPLKRTLHGPWDEAVFSNVSTNVTCPDESKRK
uniref:Phosphatidylinositol N-acetylglucosaminyltransferase subunit C n=1 Tax=Trichuris muris TaxID=70415 RepID=A0A5S6R2N6_TRIMR